MKYLIKTLQMKILKNFLSIICFVLFLTSCQKETPKVLIFSKTEGFRHGSIETGVKAIEKLGHENNFEVVHTEDATNFREENLKQYAAVIFLNTTGDVLNAEQQADFERYIQAGGGFVGVHAATDTEYDWHWYNQLVGAYFKDHPHIQKATLQVLDKNHASTSFMQDTFEKEDEWYNFKDINPDIHVLIKIDEKSYEGGKNGENHPISWYHNYDGGRSFYTEMGHTIETYQDANFLNHLLGGINYAIGNNNLDYSLATSKRVPQANRFERTVLDLNLNEPMELDELPNRGILFVERRGAIKLYDFKEEKTKTIAQLDLFYGNEDGLLGLAVDPHYEKNNWVYFFYADPEKHEQRISRFDLVGDNLVLASEKILLTIPAIRACCHSGGSLEFGPDGNLFITTGDNTNPFESAGFAPIDERPNRDSFDAQKSAANTNDLRGKILRIKPEDDGTYSIPEGNLFPEGTPKTRPEIYIMGCRNPFRMSIDSKTKYVYWGDVGPDAGKGKPDRGPKGMGEFNQARTAGNWGWPYTRGNNQAYNDFNFTTNVSGAKFDPNHLINNSQYNTGIEELPPAKESIIWYSYDKSEEFPWLGKGGVNPMAGPVFHSSDYPNAKQTFPKYYENKLFVYEWMRDWIYVVTLDENYNYKSAEPFMPDVEFSHPMDMIFGSDGNMYVLEYGQKWNAQNLDARLNRITYVSNNRAPIAKIETDKVVGGTPLTVHFSAAKSQDYDYDKLSYQWFFTDKNVQSTALETDFTFENPGVYEVVLKVTDSKGNTNETKTKIMVGNDTPEITIDIDPNNTAFWDHKKVNYKVSVNDKQDGATQDGSINANDVKVTLTYIPQGKDMVKATVGHQKSTIPSGKIIIDNSDCKACHAENEKVNGPSYLDIASKYSQKDLGYLVSKVIKGGAGVWGESPMSAHPQLSSKEVEEVIQYILSLKAPQGKNTKSLPLSGEIIFNDHTGDENEGIYVLMASYTDKGSEGQPDSELNVSEQIIFQTPKLEAENADEKSPEISAWDRDDMTIIGSIVNDSYLRFNQQKLNDLESVKLAVFYPSNYPFYGWVEVREGSSDGNLIGKSRPTAYRDNGEGGQKFITIPVQPTKDVADLFLVFKNDKDPKQFIANADWILLNYKH